MNLTYDAMDADGQSIRATIEAAGTRDAVDQLRRRGLYVTQIREGRGGPLRSSARPSVSAQGVRLPLKTLAQCTRQLAMLLKSGSALVPAMRAIRKQMVRPHHAAMFDQVIEDLEDGAPLTDALRKHPRTFDAAYCAVIAAGEASGAMAEMFDRLSHIVTKRRNMQKKIAGALAYPALLIVMCVSIFFVLLFFVLPRFSGMFDQLGVAVPASTSFLLGIGDFLRAYWPLLLGVLTLAGAGAGVFLSRDEGQQWLCDVQTGVPLFGRLRSRLIQGQVFRTMGMLLESGVSVLDTLELVRGATRNRKFQDLFDRLEEAVTSGGRLSAAFEESRLTDVYICQAVHTGEDSGCLGEAITFCADNLDDDNEELVKVTTSLIEPIILIGMGLFVGVVAVSLFMPLFDMTSAIR